jgi:hypothetical protein
LTEEPVRMFRLAILDGSCHRVWGSAEVAIKS